MCWSEIFMKYLWKIQGLELHIVSHLYYKISVAHTNRIV